MKARLRTGLFLLCFMAGVGANYSQAEVPPPIQFNPPIPLNGMACSLWAGRFNALMTGAASCFSINMAPQWTTVGATNWCIDANGNVVFLPTLVVQCI
jgi:hypothetical protein